MRRLIISALLVITLSSVFKLTAKANANTSAEQLKNNENANKLWEYCIENGCSEWWSAAVIGNACAESGLDTSMSDSNGYWGAFQFAHYNGNGHDYKADYQRFCREKNLSETDITSQYQYLFKYRGDSIIKSFTGLDSEEIQKDTTYIKDSKSAGAYFALAMEGCVCYRGITAGHGSKYHTCSSDCAEFDFTPSGGSYGKVSLQELKRRQKNSEIAYKVFADGRTSSPSENNSKKNEGSNISEVAESELQGMPDNNVLKDKQDNIELLNRDSLSTKEQYIISQVGENINISEKTKALDLSRRIIMFVGLLLVVYAIILVIAIMFDKTNNWLEISLVSLVSFGKINYNPHEEDVSSTNKYTNTKKLFISTTILFITGLVIISGTIFSKLSQIAYWFSQKFL